MSNASRLTQLQDRLAARGSRLQINEIVEQEPLPEFDRVGLELRAHRDRKGHELDMVGRVLRIKSAHIAAIEDSRFADLPGKTYAIGFVRSYAEYLGLDPNDCIRRFKIEYAEAMEPSAEQGERDDKAKLAFPEVREEVRLPHGSIIILAGILVLGVWGGWYLTTSAEREFTGAETVALPPADLPTPEDADAILRSAQATAAPVEATTTSEEDDALTVTEVGVDEPVDIPQESGPSSAEVAADTANRGASTHAEQFVAALTGTGEEGTAGEEPIQPEINATPEPQPAVAAGPRDAQVFGMQNYESRVILRARGNAWIRIEDAVGTVLFEETLQPGDSYRVPNRAGLIMATRNAGAVELLLDGESLGPAGAVGQPVLDASLDANSLAARRPQSP